MGSLSSKKKKKNIISSFFGESLIVKNGNVERTILQEMFLTAALRSLFQIKSSSNEPCWSKYDNGASMNKHHQKP